MAISTPEGRQGSGSRIKFATSFKKAVLLAEEESRHFSVSYIDTEHLVAGLAREGGVVSQALQSVGISGGYVRVQIEAINGRDLTHPFPLNADPTLTDRARKAIMLAAEHSRVNGKQDVDTEDLLQGIYREREGTGALILEMRGASQERVLQELQRLQKASS